MNNTHRRHHSPQERFHARIVLASVLSFITLVAVFPAESHAGAVYRCGNTFSESPCGEDAVKHEIFGEDSESLKGLDDKAADTCLTGIIRAGLLGNPENPRVVPTSRRKSEIVDFKGSKLMGTRIQVAISEMNPNTGVYIAGKQYQCVLTPDLERVLKTEAAHTSNTAAEASAEKP